MVPMLMVMMAMVIVMVEMKNHSIYIPHDPKPLCDANASVSLNVSLGTRHTSLTITSPRLWGLRPSEPEQAKPKPKPLMHEEHVTVYLDA